MKKVLIFLSVFLIVLTTNFISALEITNSSEDFVILSEEEMDLSEAETLQKITFFSKLINLFNNFRISGYATSCTGCIWGGKRYNTGQSIYDSVAKVCKTCRAKTCSWVKNPTATCDRTMINRNSLPTTSTQSNTMTQGASCRDPDGGANPMQKATLTHCEPPTNSRCRTFTDYCLSSTNVKEYYCKSYIYAGKIYYLIIGAEAFCSKGCKDGTCIK